MNKKRCMRTMASAFRRFMKMIFHIPYLVGGKRGEEDFATNLMIPISEAMEEKSNCFVTYNLYPKEAKEQNEWIYGRGVYSDEIAIVIQGPVVKDNNFTLETVKFYKKFFPNVLVILSTWKDEDVNYLDNFLDEENCVIVMNDYPEVEGACNINYQMVSSLGGVKKAKELGKTFVLKTRSDTRITAAGVLELLVEFCVNYPSRSLKQCQRIILFNAYLLLPYQEFGSYYFGNVDDLIMFFNAKYHQGNNRRNEYLQKDYSYREMLSNGTALNWLVKCYVEKVKRETVPCDLNSWWEDVAELFICVPVTMLRPLWVKYDYNHEESDMTWQYRRNMMGSVGIDNTMIDFAMWRGLCNGHFLRVEEYESLLDKPLR